MEATAAQLSMRVFTPQIHPPPRVGFMDSNGAHKFPHRWDFYLLIMAIWLAVVPQLRPWIGRSPAEVTIKGPGKEPRAHHHPKTALLRGKSHEGVRIAPQLYSQGF